MSLSYLPPEDRDGITRIVVQLLAGHLRIDASPDRRNNSSGSATAGGIRVCLCSSHSGSGHVPFSCTRASAMRPNLGTVPTLLVHSISISHIASTSSFLPEDIPKVGNPLDQNGPFSRVIRRAASARSVKLNRLYIVAAVSNSPKASHA